MMNSRRVYRNILVCCFAAALCGSVGVTSLAFAQFGLPKLPKLPKVKKSDAPQKKNENIGPMPELTKIEPDSAPPGGGGQIVLTGSNFSVGTSLRITCHDQRVTIGDFKVESPTRAVAHITIASGATEGPCELALEQRPTTKDASGEITASPGGTVEVVQVKTATFSISKSSPLPISVSVIYLGEGDMQFMDLMMKMQKSMQGSWGDSGKPLLVLSHDQFKLVQGDKTVFSEPASNVKEVGQMSMQGQSTGIFRIVCKNGKIYNFMEGQGNSKGEAYRIVKSTLGK
ncbi:MAG: IPT/TIG domain-containing protein [Acidobacteriia bacterium]|nr:IPT/TIG domain-containing protein [Terriglobia bacterium]